MFLIAQCMQGLNSLHDQCSTSQTTVSVVPATLFCMQKNLMMQRSNLPQFVLQRRGNPSASSSPVALCLVVYTAEYGSRSLCYSANQSVIPVLLMWEVMLHATLSFSHQRSLCLCHYLSSSTSLSEGLLLLCDWAIVLSHSQSQPVGLVYMDSCF